MSLAQPCYPAFIFVFNMLQCRLMKTAYVA